MFLSFDALLNDTNESVNKLCDFTVIKFKKINLVNNFLDKTIKHNNSTIENISNEIPSFLKSLINRKSIKIIKSIKLYKIYYN